MTRQRVLVLGGGCGGVATAWALSRSAALRERFEVTLVQPGWRLGGKGATGRDPARGHAILEHGLHLWLGFYHQAFTMMADVYRGWAGPRTGPQASIETAFSPMRDVTLFGGEADELQAWRLRFPEVRGRPWDPLPSRAVSYSRLASSWAAGLGAAFIDTPGQRWTAQRLALLGRLGTAIARGLALETRRHGSDPWLAMDELDLRDWLRAHGAGEAEVTAPPIRALYDLGFAYPDGRPRPDGGQAAAGVALRVLLNIFAGYRGAPFWRMNAGMGDTVFAPAFEVLRARGVRFRFFERLTHLGYDGAGIGSVELGVQATGAENYQPLLDVGDIRAWPHAPLSEQLDEIATGDLEQDDGTVLGHRTLRRGHDFDDVVLAIPSTGHRLFAGELIEASPRYAAMVGHTHAVATVAGQWWMSRRPARLGWEGPVGVATGMPGLFRTWADLSELVDAERWAERPEAVAYFCNVAPPDIAACRDRSAAGALVAARMRQWASTDLHRIWPQARTASGSFDEGSLHAIAEGDPWRTAYARANVAAWERYVLSLPGTTKHRLAPDDSGFDNLFLAGDWTHNRVNGGSVEGAVTSGVAAARGIAMRVRGTDRANPEPSRPPRVYSPTATRGHADESSG
jgi:uncharacterized protein with NAD-binding domain and iron-sulfur cluster